MNKYEKNKYTWLHYNRDISVAFCHNKINYDQLKSIDCNLIKLLYSRMHCFRDKHGIVFMQEAHNMLFS